MIDDLRRALATPIRSNNTQLGIVKHYSPVFFLQSMADALDCG